ncbi:MAG: transglycosylase domain-containing protein, partial [Saezia sp.]
MSKKNGQKALSFWPKWKRRLRYLLIGLFLLACVLGIVRLYPHPPLKDLTPYSRLVTDENGALLRMTLASDEHYRLWIALEDISPSMVDSILLKEDRQFYSHPGVNFSSIIRAALSTYMKGNRQGGSTISMQLARKVYDINSRTLMGKAHQVMMALWLEACYSKHDILEAYLNLAPMGGNVEGVEAASRIYFHKSATDLTLMESLAQAVIPQRPTARASFGDDLQAAHKLLMQDWYEHYPDDPRTRSLLDLPVHAYQRSDLPFIAPHYTDYLLANSTAPHIQGTLNSTLQKELELLVHQYIQIHRSKGVENAAVLLVDTRDLSVKSMIGSADYSSVEIHGQVNGTMARRSPGSTLKPFLYALAIDQGIIHPMTMLKDVS